MEYDVSRHARVHEVDALTRQRVDSNLQYMVTGDRFLQEPRSRTAGVVAGMSRRLAAACRRVSWYCTMYNLNRCISLRLWRHTVGRIRLGHHGKS